MSSPFSDPSASMETTARRSPWPYAILCSFLALAVFDAGIITLALSTRTAEIETNPYEAGLAFESVLEAKRAVKEDNVKFEIAEKAGAVRIHLSGLEKGLPYFVTVKLLRPDAQGLDLQETLQLHGPEIEYTSPTIREGLWLATVLAKNDSRSYQFGPEKFVLSNSAARIE